jgi:hypothetical protein
LDTTFEEERDKVVEQGTFPGGRHRGSSCAGGNLGKRGRVVHGSIFSPLAFEFRPARELCLLD